MVNKDGLCIIHKRSQYVNNVCTSNTIGIVLDTITNLLRIHYDDNQLPELKRSMMKDISMKGVNIFTSGKGFMINDENGDPLIVISFLKTVRVSSIDKIVLDMLHLDVLPLIIYHGNQSNSYIKRLIQMRYSDYPRIIKYVDSNKLKILEMSTYTKKFRNVTEVKAFKNIEIFNLEYKRRVNYENSNRG